MLLWLQVIRMHPLPDIYSLWPETGCRGCRRWTLSWYLWLRPPIPFILIADLLYTYIMQFSTCYCGWRSYGCRHTLIFTLYDLRVDLLGGVGGGSLLVVLMIEASHPLHTHSRFSSYIYNALQHLLLRLVDIRMPPHPDICSLRPESGCCWYRRWVSVSSFDWGPPHTSYSWQVFFIHMLNVSAPWTVATGHKDAATLWYLLSMTWEWMPWVQKVDSQSVLMIKTPHPVHTHSRSSFDIY